MKKYINILFAAAVSALALVSCVKEQEVKPGTPDAEDCQGVYFPKQDIIEEAQIFDPNQTKVAFIKVARTVSEGTLTLAPKVSLTETTSTGSADGDVSLFIVSDIDFEDGQTETEIEIEFPNVEENVQYTLHLAIEGDEYTSKYSSKVNTCDFNVMCVAYQDFLNPVTQKPAKVTFTEGWWSIVVEAKIKYYIVDGVRFCETYDEKVISSKNEDAGDVGFWGAGKDNHLYFKWFPSKKDAAGNQMIDIEKQYLGYDYNDWLAKPIAQAGNPIFAYDWFHFLITDGGYAGGWDDWEGFLEKNPGVYDRSYYDGNGGFFLNFRYYIPGLGGWTPDPFDTVGIAEGFTRADYSIKLTSGITEKDDEENNVVPVSFKLGPDADLVGYSILEGQASASAIEKEVAALTKETEEIAKEKDAWLAGEVDFSKFTNTWVFAKGKSFTDYIAPKEGSTGFYTVVAVAVDTAQVRTGEGAERKISEVKLAVKNDANVFFKYINDDEANTVILNVTAGSTEKYASRGFSATSSLEYTISGVGITGAIPMVLSEADVEKEGGIDAYVAGMLEDPNAYYAMLSDKDYAKYVLSPEALADVNEKAYSDIESGLKANTTYYVVVWATNGYHCGVEYAVHTTDGLPNVVISNGTGYYTYNWLDETDNITFDGYSLEYNPNTAMYEIPKWGANGSATFTFSVAADNKTLSVPVQSTGYSSYGLADYSHVDDIFGPGAADYFSEKYGIDFSPRGFIDEDGNYNFVLFYYSSEGNLWLIKEIFYPNGKPVEAPTAPVLFSVKGVNKPTVDEILVDARFIKVAGVSGLEPVASSYKKVDVKHSYSIDFNKRNGKSEMPQGSTQLLNR